MLLEACIAMAQVVALGGFGVMCSSLKGVLSCTAFNWCMLLLLHPLL